MRLKNPANVEKGPEETGQTLSQARPDHAPFVQRDRAKDETGPKRFQANEVKERVKVKVRDCSCFCVRA